MGHGFVVHTTCLDVVYCGISGVSRPVVLDCRLASLNWASLRMSSVVGAEAVLGISLDEQETVEEGVGLHVLAICPPFPT